MAKSSKRYPCWRACFIESSM